MAGVAPPEVNIIKKDFGSLNNLGGKLDASGIVAPSIIFKIERDVRKSLTDLTFSIFKLMTPPTQTINERIIARVFVTVGEGLDEQAAYDSFFGIGGAPEPGITQIGNQNNVRFDVHIFQYGTYTYRFASPITAEKGETINVVSAPSYVNDGSTINAGIPDQLAFRDLCIMGYYGDSQDARYSGGIVGKLR